MEGGGDRRRGGWGGREGKVEGRNIRSGIGVQQNVPVLQILHIGPVLEVFLQAVSTLQAARWGDGRLVDVGVRHGVCSVSAYVFVWSSYAMFCFCVCLRLEFVWER